LVENPITLGLLFEFLRILPVKEEFIKEILLLALNIDLSNEEMEALLL
jgi:hypothetical protein